MTLLVHPTAGAAVASHDRPGLLYTDAGNGSRFAELHQADYRFVRDVGVWIRFDGKRWANADEGAMLRAAKDVAARIFDEALMMVDEDASKRAKSWAIKSSSAPRLEAMIKLASSEESLSINSADLDRHDDLLCVNNGVVDLRTGSLRDHCRTDYMTKLVDIDYSPTADAVRFKLFVAEIFDNRADLIHFVQVAIGYSLTGHTREQAFFLMVGGGCNGKGRLVRVLDRLGGDAAVSTAFATLAADRGQAKGATPELADLFGARVVIAGEPDEGMRLSEGLIKLLTGDDTITARRLYQAPFSFVPRFKLWMHANHRPKIVGTDDGIWRRPRLIPFDVSFRGREDKELDAKLEAELPGILTWAVQGAMHWFANGLPDAGPVTVATSAYREESDTIGQFLADAFALGDESAFITSKSLYEDFYETWCEANAHEPLTAISFGRKLAAREGIRSGKHNKQRGFFGLHPKESS